MKIRDARSLFLFVLVFGALGCAAEVSSEEELDPAVTSEELLNLRGDDGSALWTIRDIPVCFDPTTVARPDFATFSRDARSWIDDTYGRILNLRFIGWGKCPSVLTNMISIRLFEGNGAQTIAESGTKANSNRRISIGDKKGPRRAVLVHEFAHALGFSHEHLRKDGTGECHAAGDKGGERFGTPYDPYSITNSTYCGSWSNLSPWDVVGMRKAYGRKPSGSIVGLGNKCLDVDNPTTSNPSSRQTQVWDCLGNDNQYWSIEHGKNRLTTPWSTGALDVQWGNSADGTPTWNYERNDSVAQQWYFKGVEVRGMGDLCLDVPDGNFAWGQSLQMWECVGNDNQKWDVEVQADRKRISLRASSSPDLCVSIEDGVRLLPCGRAGTSHYYGGRGQINFGQTQCMDVSNAVPQNGALVVSYPCRESLTDPYRQAQEWTFRGPIRGLGGKCLEVDTSGGVRASSKTRINTCNGSPEQTWEYYFY